MSQPPIPADTLPAVPGPGRVGQGTAVEQSRAVAEVQAAIIVAQQCPRSMTTARTAMLESCQMLALAERAFYRFPKGGSTVSGPSVHLARELARCFGNVQYGINELRRDEVAVDDEFPQPRVTVDEITAGAGVTPAESPPAAGASAGSTPASAAPGPDREYGDNDPERPFE